MPTLSNTDRAQDSGQADLDTIRDRDREETVMINSFLPIVVDYIPFGANQLVKPNHNVGAAERVQGKYLFDAADGDAGSTALELASKFMSVISQHQRKLLDLVFIGDT